MAAGAGEGVRVENLVKEYGRLRAVDGVSFEVGPGEVLGLLGPNGAGKTTVMRVLASIIRPTSGRAYVGGLDVQRDRGRVRRLVGYLPERSGLHDGMTVERYLTLFARLYGVSSVETRVREVSEELKIADRLSSKIGGLSKGLRQRVSMARALIHDPPVLLLDEPTSGLDPLSRAEVLALISELGRSGRTVLVSSHVLSEMERVCTRVCLISRGRVLALGRLDEVRLLARRPLIRVVVDDPDSLIARIVGDGVELSASRRGNLVEIEVAPDRIREVAGRVMRAAVDAGVVPELFEIHRPTLEEAFFRLVGGDVA